MITAGGTVTSQTGASSTLAPTNTPSVVVKRADPKMAPHSSTSMEGGSMADSSQTWNVISPMEHDGEGGVSRNCGSEERVGHERGEGRERDRKWAGEDEIGRIERRENSRT